MTAVVALTLQRMHRREAERVKRAHAQAARRWFSAQGICWRCGRHLDARGFIAWSPTDMIVSCADPLCGEGGSELRRELRLAKGPTR